MDVIRCYYEYGLLMDVHFETIYYTIITPSTEFSISIGNFRLKVPDWKGPLLFLMNYYSFYISIEWTWNINHFLMKKGVYLHEMKFYFFKLPICPLFYRTDYHTPKLLLTRFRNNTAQKKLIIFFLLFFHFNSVKKKVLCHDSKLQGKSVYNHSY